MGAAPIKNRSRFHGIRDLRRLWGERVDECIRQFPLALDFLGHGTMPHFMVV